MADTSIFATPQARQGPTSRVLRRRSQLPPPGITSPRITSPTKRLAQPQGVDFRVNNHQPMDIGNPEGEQVQKAAQPSFSSPGVGRSFLNTTSLHNTEHTFGAFNLTKSGVFNLTRAAADLNYTNLSAYELPATTVIDPDHTMLAMDAAAPVIQSTDNLYVDFMAAVSEESSGASTLDQVAELEDLVTGQNSNLKAHGAHPNVTFGGTNVYRNMVSDLCDTLGNEKNTWRLLGKLYLDRLTADVNDDDVEKLLPSVARTSEKKLIENLFLKSRELREGQIVVEWLEANARDDFDENARLHYFADGAVSWENTLAVLKGEDKVYRRPIVASMDPDAPRREGKPLHDLDAEDQEYLLKSMFICIRAGLLDTAQDLCIRVGQPWRSACLEGWKLFHDPNYGRCSSSGGGLEDKLPVEGNKNRDIWKRAVWKMIQDDKLTVYERAIFAPFCGNVSFLLNLCANWEDWLWAYSRCMVDLHVETEIREKMPKAFEPLPQEYWDNNKKTFKEIFACISASDNREVQTKSLNPYHVVQKYLIEGDLLDLLQVLDDWTNPDNTNTDEQIKDPHLLRFLAHLVIIIRRIHNHGKFAKDPANVGCDDKGSRVLHQYCLFLMSKDRVQQVAWYVSQLFHVDEQIELYAMFLQTIYADSDRRLTITLAQEAGLHIDHIKSRVVENVFAIESMLNGDGEEDEELLIRRKIDAISWLIYEPSQRDEAVYQANTLTRRLIAMDKFDYARECSAKIPQDLMDIISAHCTFEGELSARQSNSVAEYRCWEIYFRGKEAFNDWFDHYHKSKPVQPRLPENANFTEKVAYEQKLKQYSINFERWQSNQELQSAEAVERLNACIAFPGGWLIDQFEEATDEVDEQRLLELDYLRKFWMPKVILLLHSVLHSTGKYEKAIKLADLVASEKHCLYEIYSKENMEELLQKVRESSLEAMATGLTDPWGYKTNS